MQSNPTSNGSLPGYYATFSFPQQEIKVSALIQKGVHNLLQANVSPNHILDIYLDSQILKKSETNRDKNDPIKNPLQYLRAVNGLKDNSNVRYHDFEKVFNYVVNTWKNIAPFEFMMQYDSALHYELYHKKKGYQPKKNDSGLECGMIFERLMKQVGDNDHLIVIDPSPAFVVSACSDSNFCSKQVSLHFANSRLAEIYRKQTNLPNRFEWLSLDSLMATPQPTRIVLFGSNATYEDSLQTLQTVRERFAQCRNYYLFFLLPTAFYDRRGMDSALRTYIHTNFSLRQAVLIDPKAVNNAPTKRCMLVLQHPSLQQISVHIEKASLITDGKKQQIACSKSIPIPYFQFRESNKTLSALHDLGENGKNKTRQRKLPMQHALSLEISIYFSVTTLPSEKLRGKYHFYDYPDTKAELKNVLPRGKPLCTNISGKVVADLDEIHAYAEELPFINENLGAAIRNAVKRKYKGAPLSCKSTWLVYLPDLELSEFETELAKSIFLGNDNSICRLLIASQTSSEDVRSAVETYAGENNISPTRCEKIYLLLSKLFSIAIQKKHTNSNPVQHLLERHYEQKERTEDLRDALVVRSFSTDTMRRLLTRLNGDTEHPALALAIKTKTLMKLSSGEVAALCLNDYFKCTDADLKQLCISKTFPQTGHSAILLERKWQNRLHPVPVLLQEQLDAWYRGRVGELQQLGIDEKDVGPYPLFAASDSITPYRRRALNEYCSKIIKELGLPDLWLDITDEENDTEESEYTNIGVYHGDLLQSNWVYHAAHTGQMNIDEICYLSGRNPKHVVARHYLEFLHPDEQMRMRTKLDTIIANLTLPPFEGQTAQTSLNISANRRRYIPYTPTAEPSDLYCEVTLFDGDSLDIEFANHYGCTITIERI